MNKLLNDKGMSGREIVNELQETGILISKSTFFNYLNGETIPKLDTGLNILLYFDGSINRHDVQTLINNSQNEKENLFITKTDNKRHVHILVEDEELLIDRLKEYDNNLSKYINDLVRKDLNKYRKEINKYEIWQVIRKWDGDN